jgi:hypothetical protein
MSALPAEEPFIASVAEPEGGRASIGVIVIGMGMADVRVVKRLAKLGFLGVQMRLIKDTAHHRDVQRRFATYDSTGVARCRLAMDALGASHGIKQFILMGNCALANISFNTALADSRVVGLILTNPYVSKRLTSSLLFRLRWHLLRRRSWQRLLRGEMNVRPLDGLLRMVRRRSGTSPGTPSPGPERQALGGDVNPSDMQGTVALDLKQNMVLPLDFDRRLECLLQERRMRVLLAFSENEAGLEYFRRYYGRLLRRLIATGCLRFEVIDTQVHDFSARDDSAVYLNDIVTDWVGRTWA